MFVASNMVLLIVHVKMIAAPLLLKLRTAVLSLRNLGDDDAEPEAAAARSEQDWHLANGTSGTIAPSEVVFTSREPQPIVDFALVRSPRRPAIRGPLTLAVNDLSLVAHGLSMTEAMHQK